jgi:hypothetical protein
MLNYRISSYEAVENKCDTPSDEEGGKNQFIFILFKLKNEK